MRNLVFSALIILIFTPLTIAEYPKDADAVSPECQQILADLKVAQDQHNAAYKAKGKAYINWRKYFDQIHSDSYLNTDKPLLDSVEECKGQDKPDKDFCKGVMDRYNEISPKEKAAKEELVKAQEKSDGLKMNFNQKLRVAADKNCIMK